MHKLLSTALLGLLLVDGVGVIDDRSPIGEVKTNVIGPFDKFQNDVQIKFIYFVSSRMANITEELRTFNGATGVSYSKSTTANHTVTSKIANATFTLPLKKYFGDEGLKIKFTILQSGSALFTSEATIYPREPKTINVTKQNVQRVESKDLAFKLEKNEMILYRDDFNFVGFKNYIDADSYYSLTLSNNRFIYNQDTLTCESAKLVVNDTNLIFRYLPHTDRKVYLDLAVNNRKTYKSFRYKDDFYVNKFNLECSYYEIPDSVMTNNFYLPINKKRDFLGSKLELNLHNCGLNNYDFTFELTYDIFKNLVGSCINSDYCVKGEIE